VFNYIFQHGYLQLQTWEWLRTTGALITNHTRGFSPHVRRHTGTYFNNASRSEPKLIWVTRMFYLHAWTFGFLSGWINATGGILAIGSSRIRRLTLIQTWVWKMKLCKVGASRIWWLTLIQTRDVNMHKTNSFFRPNFQFVSISKLNVIIYSW
jgi:hypothetical protein